jgi:CheY-like chemotaxis protein
VILEAVPFRLAEFIRHRCAGLKIKAIDKNLNFIVDIDKQLEETIIISDPTRLSQLIYNLVSNAIKFTDKGSITIKLDCIHKKENGVEVLFSVTDTGIGIQPDRHETIFNLFTQAESDITRKYGGTGLGLAIVKQVLTLFNSKIQLDSTPGKGSKFYFTLPFITTTEETISGVKIAPVSETTNLGHLRILIAEDNELNRLLMQKQLDKFNIKPVIVENGEQAYQACLSGYYDAIFMDLHMPILDGYQATNKIRSITDPVKAKVYIIAFTASVTEQEKIFDNGFNDFLYKPVNMNDVRDKLEKINLYTQARL